MKHGLFIYGIPRSDISIGLLLVLSLGLCMTQTACTPPPGKLCAGVDCGDNGQCVVVGGGANCECAVGYHPEGLTCVPDGDAGVPDGAVDSCGNGVSELGEMCDGEDLRGETCVSLGGDGGELSCRPNCAYFDTSDCLTTCGDGFMGASEQCDATDVGGLTCLDLGYYGGTLACTEGCTYDLASCEAAGRCGDDSVQAAQGEECDDINLGGATCTSIGFYEGTLACGAPNAQNACRFDTAACGGFCGDGLVQTSHTEVCDATNLNGETCEAFGYDSGTLACQSNCDAFDVTGCTGAPQPCGNGVIDTGEVCDGVLLVGEDCASQGFSGGALACNATCDAFVTTACIAVACGNGFVDSPEQCDDGNLLSHDGCSSCCTDEDPGWAQVTGSTTGDRDAGAMVFDTLRDRIVLFGGRIWGSPYNADTFEFDFVTGAWVQQTPAMSPEGRRDPAMVFDEGRGVTVMFGGDQETGLGYLGDTWEYDGTIWNEILGGVSPSPRSQARMVYDSSRGRIVLFGGGTTSLGTLNDTWEFDGSSWSLLPTANAPARQGHGMVYDAVRDRVVLFGGSDEGAYPTDTWEYDGVDWTQQTTATSPPGRTFSSMVYHAAREVTSLFGGIVFTPVTRFQDVWEYDGQDWTSVTASNPPSNRKGIISTYDSLRPSLWVHGGEYGNAFSNQTWRLDWSIGGCAEEVCDNGSDDDGDGLTDCADPDCDNHPCPTGFCRAGACMAPICGNGYLEVGEACDDGLANSDTAPGACRTTCQLPSCGDGVLDTNEICEVGGVGGNDCTTIGQAFQGGTLACNATCDGWYTLNCWEGHVVYVDDVSGVLEVWAIKDNGTDPVRLTDGMTSNTGNWPSNNAIMSIDVSWDHQHIAFMCDKVPGGGNDFNARVYTMEPDGANLQVAANAGAIWLGLGWESDSQHIVYTKDVVCDDDLYRVDGLTPNTPTLLWDGSPIAGWPSPHPTDPNLILHNNWSCSNPMVVNLLNISASSASPLAYLPGQIMPHWSAGGDRIVYNQSDGVYVAEYPGGQISLPFTIPVNYGVGSPVFGNSDTRLYGSWSYSSAYDLISIDLATGLSKVFNVRSVAYPSYFIDWGRFDIEIDCDGDGLGNGIDPSPGC